jgi:hypothetical protein
MLPVPHTVQWTPRFWRDSLTSVRMIVGSFTRPACALVTIRQRGQKNAGPEGPAFFRHS